MNTEQRKALRQHLSSQGFDRSSFTPEAIVSDPEAKVGEYNETWVNDNNDEVEIRWGAKT